MINLEAPTIRPPSTGGEIVIPSHCRQDALDRIIDRTIAGESLKLICKPDNMPSMALVRRWMSTNTAFNTRYIQAQATRALEEASKIIDIADGNLSDVDDVARDRLRVQTRLKLVEKLIPAYGNRISHELSVSEQLENMLTAARNTGHVLPSEIIEGEIL